MKRNSQHVQLRSNATDTPERSKKCLASLVIASGVIESSVWYLCHARITVKSTWINYEKQRTSHSFKNKVINSKCTKTKVFHVFQLNNVVARTFGGVTKFDNNKLIGDARKWKKAIEHGKVHWQNAHLFCRWFSISFFLLLLVCEIRISAQIGCKHNH